MKPVLIVLTLVLVICPAPAAQAEDEDVTRIYDVGALLSGEVAPRLEVLGLPPGIGSPEEFLEFEDDEEEPVPFIDGDALAEIVNSQLSAAGDDQPSVLDIQGRHLVVRGPAAAQAIVGRLLAALWREASQRITVEGHWLRFGAAGRVALRDAGLLASLEKGRLDGKALGAVLAAARDPSNEISSASTVLLPGRRGTLGRVASRSYVQDYGVEIAQDSRVGDPFVESLGTGWFIDVRPYLLQDGTVLMDVVGQAAGVEGPIRVQALEVEPFGSVELPVCSALRFVGAGRAQPDHTLAWLSAPEGAAGRLEVLLLRPGVRSARAETAHIRRYGVSRLTTPALRWRMERLSLLPGLEQGALTPPRLVPAEPWEAVVEEDALLDAVTLCFEEEIWERGGTSMLQLAGALLVEGDAAVHEGVRNLLRDRERALDTGRLGVRLLSTNDTGDAQVLCAAWLDVPYGRSVGWQAGTERAYVADWDVEVAQEERVGDPIVSTVFDGLAMTLVLDRAPVAGHASLRLDLAYTDVDPKIEIRRLENECTGIVEVPKLDLVAARQNLVLKAGVVETIDSGNLQDGRRFQIEIVLVR